MRRIHFTGAEAELSEVEFDGQLALSKKRIPKAYRNKELDIFLRTTRTRSEGKLLYEASQVVTVPQVLAVNAAQCEIIMERIDGVALKHMLVKTKNKATAKKMCVAAGKHIRALHDAGIIHGDLTTSNILVRVNASPQKAREKNSLVFVDFGLGFFSRKLEDNAVDMVVFKKTFHATHSDLKGGWQSVMQGYAPHAELRQRMEVIEKRGRYQS